LRGEESPGSTEKRCRITSGGGDPRESATERIPPAFAQVRVKGWGKSPPRAWQHGWQGKPHREQDRIGMTWFAQAFRPFPGQSSGWVAGGNAQALSQMNGCHVPAFGSGPYRTRLTGQLANSPFFKAVGGAFLKNAYPFECSCFLDFTKFRLTFFRVEDSALNPRSWHVGRNLLLNLTDYQYLPTTHAEIEQIPLTPIWSHVIPIMHCTRAD
jgi:hypothetical protein